MAVLHKTRFTMPYKQADVRLKKQRIDDISYINEPRLLVLTECNSYEARVSFCCSQEVATMSFVFGKPEGDPAVIYVNQESISNEIYQRLCTNPSRAIMLYDKLHVDINKNEQMSNHQSSLSSIYDGYGITQFGISTMFHNHPSLTECQSIWNVELHLLKQECIKNASIIIIESNPIQVCIIYKLCILIFLKPLQPFTIHRQPKKQKSSTH